MSGPYQSVWIVGRHIQKTDQGAVWEFSGVYDTVERADSACLDETYFYGPATLNEQIPHKSVEWPGCLYPRAAEGMQK